MTVISTTEQNGAQVQVVSIQAAQGKGFAGLQLVGNVAEAGRDSLERVKVVLQNLGVDIPQRRIVLSFSPSLVRKQSTHFDLPLALLLMGHLNPKLFPHSWERYVFAAEMDLHGRLRGMEGVVGAALAAQKAGYLGIIVAHENASQLASMERSVVGKSDFSVLSFSHLAAVKNWLQSGEFEPYSAAQSSASQNFLAPQRTFSDMQLDEDLQTLAQVWAIGKHSLHLRGAPGCGKSMFAHRLPSLLPPLPDRTFREVAQIHSAHHQPMDDRVAAGWPPFRQPHHQASAAALMGTAARPGELALAHGGVLFLDEVVEFRRDLLEALRQPLETGEVHVARAQGSLSWQCRVMLVVASNPCPCGWSGSSIRLCGCPQNRVDAYQRRLSGPLLDRIDLQVNMPEWKGEDTWFAKCERPVSTNDIQKTMTEGIHRATEFQKSRARDKEPNSGLDAATLVKVCGQSGRTIDQWTQPCVAQGLSRRKIIRVLRVARSLADLQLSPSVSRDHFQRALQWANRQRGKASAALHLCRIITTP